VSEQNVTTTRRGWRVALESPLLRTVVVCGSLSVLLTATPAASVIAGRTMAVASAEPGALCVAPRTDAPAVDTGESRVVETNAAAPFGSRLWWTGTSESIPRDAAEEDDNDDDDALHSLSSDRAHSLEIRRLSQLELDPSISLESDGHSLRAPPQ
jgi:hypothetical protein